jgi:hypothetical protein
MPEAYYLQVTLEPHHKHSGLTTGRRILFLAEVPIEAAKKSAANPDDEKALYEEAERLAGDLAPIAMTGCSRQTGEDIMRMSYNAIPTPPYYILERTADAEKDGIRLWLLGANVE